MNLDVNLFVELILNFGAAGTNPIHNKKPKKKAVEEDDEDKAFKLKQAAGKSHFPSLEPTLA